MKAISKSYIKHLASLKEKYNRDLHNEYVVEGSKSVKEFLNYPKNIKAIFALPQWINENEKLLKNIKEIHEVSENVLNRISSLKTANKVIALVEKNNKNIEILFDDIILVLDNIQDPGNFGTIIRIADWFGIDYIVHSSDTVDPYNPKVIQASMGSFCRIKIIEKQLEDFLKGVPQNTLIYASCLDAEPIYNANKAKKSIIIIGNEARGISENLLKFVTKKISIPKFKHSISVVGSADSLNAAMATAIMCYEFRK